MNEKVLMLFENCRVTKGFVRSIIIDIQRYSYHFIPNSFADFCDNYNRKKISYIINSVNEDKIAVVEEYIEFLLINDYASVVSESISRQFPEISFDKTVPKILDNSIITLSNSFSPFYSKVINELSDLGTIAIQINLIDKIDVLYNCLDLLDKSSIELIHLYIDNKIFNFSEEDLLNLKVKYYKITLIVAYNSETSKEIDNKYDVTSIFLCDKNITDLSCGFVCESKFRPNINFYSEAVNHNTCLNRKISIDLKGNIKNCPSMQESFGNIKDTTLAEAIEKPGFKKYWNINKDKIHVCKDCEFRYICTDCRAYIEDPEDILSKPLKCGYNPYTGDWSEWSTNPLKQKAIDFYGMREIPKLAQVARKDHL